MPGLHLALAALVLQSPCADTTARAEDTLPWRRVIRRLDCERTQLADELPRVHAVLKGRATTEAPALLARIEVAAPRPLPSGCAFLPELLTDPPQKGIPLTESRFSLEALSGSSATYLRESAALGARVDSREALEPLVTELERHRQLKYLESSITYHRFWQQSAIDAKAFFAEKNLLVARARALKALQQAGADSATAALEQRALAADFAPFRLVPGLVWRMEQDSSRVLPMEIVTDITDSPFLARLEAAIDRAWNQSRAARAQRFRILLRFSRVPPESLYPEGVPARGSQIVEANHMARFPQGALVLTTGAKHTHAYNAHYVQLGTTPVGP